MNMNSLTKEVHIRSNVVDSLDLYIFVLSSRKTDFQEIKYFNLKTKRIDNKECSRAGEEFRIWKCRKNMIYAYTL